MSRDAIKRKPLGRGLSALLGETPELPPEHAPDSSALRTVPIEQLRPGRYQPRRQFDEVAMAALVESIREKGILQPILVRRHGEDGWEIVAGERRWRAAQAAGIHAVPVLIQDMDDRAALEIALVENVQRQDLTALEEAEGYQRLIDEFGHRQEDLAKAVGKSRSHIANTLRLLQLPPDVRRLVQDGALSAGHGRALLGASEAGELARRVVAQGLNVRQTEKLATAAKDKPARAPAPESDADTRALERSLEAQLGLRVNIEHGGRGGRLVLHYGSLDQLDEVLKRLAR
ncbi:ParB family chromosome partitioning protein [Stella humosa]|uniref:ParB family chromosome partitioning protein n=1 Tax=Stella humosa TaxID=94 RepID=A0A3N1LIA3_9PROT|nr:ParB/RepB/Spo0J family partition protein [Stella humosa]ROP90944.1 ParB family chromosome partitioning protein [Stella humosa]BBK34706.1 chromosome partitioning protein ParB [Stella humosa]